MMRSQSVQVNVINCGSCWIVVSFNILVERVLVLLVIAPVEYSRAVHLPRAAPVEVPWFALSKKVHLPAVQ